MAYGEPFVTSCEAKVDYSGLLDDVFKTMIFPKMCKGMDNVVLLSFLHGWRLVFKGWKEVSCTNVVWRVFQVSKVDVAASHWSRGEDIMPKPLSNDVWKHSLKVLQNKRIQKKVKEDVSLVSILKFENIKNEMDLLLGDKVLGQCQEALEDCECDIMFA
jgi:hypothetical protein